jgi:arylsulfatase A-like enzyme
LISAARGQNLPQPVELRDLLPTFMEAASAPLNREIDGRSLLSLVRNTGAGWREYIDLEHNITYSPENHWNALTDGRLKYIFHARDGEEQLFDLERDPHELQDLASVRATNPSSGSNALIDHFSSAESHSSKTETGAPPRGLMLSPNFQRSRMGGLWKRAIPAGEFLQYGPPARAGAPRHSSLRRMAANRISFS